MNKGFTLYETIVSLAVIVMISILSATACLFSNKSILKSKALNFGLTQIENVSKIYKNTSVESLGALSFESLKTNINQFYETEIFFTENLAEGSLQFEIKFDNSFKKSDTGLTKIVVNYKLDSGYLKMAGIIFYGDNLIFENDNVFEKAVML